MEKGKRICQVLKDLRKRIADANNIPFEMEECTHRGDCPGTCPRCESELRYLMDSIDKREQEGKPVVLDGIMSEEELRKAFSIIPTEENVIENPGDVETMCLTASRELLTLFGEEESPLEGETTPYFNYNYSFASVIFNALIQKLISNDSFISETLDYITARERLFFIQELGEIIWENGVEIDDLVALYREIGIKSRKQGDYY